MYILCLSRGLDAIKNWKKEARSDAPIAFIPNAGDTYADPYFVHESEQRLQLLGLQTRTIDLRKVNSSSEFEEQMSDCSGIFVAGGNSYNLLNELYRSGSFSPLKRLVSEGFPYFGESAGAVILYRSIEPVAMIDDPQDVPNIISTDAFDLVDFITLPHIDREKYSDLFESFYEKFSPAHKIVRIRDDQAIITEDGSNFRIIPSPIRALG